MLVSQGIGMSDVDGNEGCRLPVDLQVAACHSCDDGFCCWRTSTPSHQSLCRFSLRSPIVQDKSWHDKSVKGNRLLLRNKLLTRLCENLAKPTFPKVLWQHYVSCVLASSFCLTVACTFFLARHCLGGDLGKTLKAPPAHPV